MTTKYPKALASLKKYCVSQLHKEFECQVCHTTKELIIHHMKYFFTSVIYKQFPDTYDGRIQYHAKLLDEIKDNKLFNILCMGCHDDLHELLKMEYYKATNLTHKTQNNYPPEMEIIYLDNVEVRGL